MSDKQSNNKRIMKNTILLYGRMLLMMAINLYTSRVILRALGVEDYGIYNVVGGVVSMFTILSGSLSSAISRYITFELGKGDMKKLNSVFCTAINVQIILIIIIAVLLETVGLWFLNYKMDIPSIRLYAANWVFQFSIITFAINLWSVPYNASIIAHERMSAFAYISIFDAVAKLITAFVILKSPIDSLIFYGALVMVIGMIQRLLYSVYCKRNFEECSYRVVFDNKLTKEMFSFAGWNFFGSGSWQLMTQGVNLLLNLFFGVTANAARGIANQVDAAVLQFVNSFTTAINPQITKSYAIDDKDYLYELMCRGARFSYFLLLFFAIPIICETGYLLKAWLGIVPDYSVTFVRLALVTSLIHVMSNTMITAILATGNIKRYQIIVGGLGMLVFPIAWLLFYLGFPPSFAYVSTIIIFLCQLLCRLHLLNDIVGMSPYTFIKEVIVRISKVTLLASVIPFSLVSLMEDGFIRFITIGTVSVISSLTAMWFVGMTVSERHFFLSSVQRIIKK